MKTSRRVFTGAFKAQVAIEALKVESKTLAELAKQYDKYLLWGNILRGSDPSFPAIRFNGSKCKFTLISMNNTQVIHKEGKFTKNKASERSKTILPEVATHFSDAVDKRIWTKYGHLLTAGHSFVPART
jgi:hypothetical protein